jgi:hypothetical protein
MYVYVPVLKATLAQRLDKTKKYSKITHRCHPTIAVPRKIIACGVIHKNQNIQKSRDIIGYDTMGYQVQSVLVQVPPLL